MLHRISLMRFRDKLLIALILIAILPTAFIGMVSYYVSGVQMRQQIQSAQKLILSNAASGVSKRLEDAKKVSELTQYYFVKEMMLAPAKPTDYANLIRIQTLKSSISLLRSRFDIPRIQVFLSDENIYSEEGINFFPFTNFRQALAGLGVEGDLSGFTGHDGFCFKPKDVSRLKQETTDSIRLFRAIRSVYGSEVVAGYFVDIDLGDFGRFADELVNSYPPDTGADCMIVDGQGRVLYSTAPERINTPMDAGLYGRVRSGGDGILYDDGVMLTSQRIREADWLLIAMLPERYMASQMMIISRFAVVATVASIIITLLASIAISSLLTKKIRVLANTMEGQTPEGTGIPDFRALRITSFAGVETSGSRDEIDHLIHSYHMMLQRIEALMQQVVSHETEAEKQRFSLLQAQIKPHFLYNVLESINACILSGKSGEASAMIYSLSQFYREHLNNRSDLVSIRDELRGVTLYLRIEELCHAGMLTWDVQAEEPALDFSIPRFTLQPIVENCVVHGMKRMGKALRIHLNCAFDQEDIVLTVTDDGSGLSEELHSQLADVLEKGMSDTKGHFGITNVNARIRLQFGAQYGVRLERMPGGTRVTVRIPPELLGEDA